jgi:TonB family protein
MISKINHSRIAGFNIRLTTVATFSLILLFSLHSFGNGKSITDNRFNPNVIQSDQPTSKKAIEIQQKPVLKKKEKEKTDYEEGKIICEFPVSQSENASKDEDNVYLIAEEEPKYPGGKAAFRKFIQKNINYPKRAIISKVQGTVFVQFVVLKSGKVTKPKVLWGIGYGCDEEALRLVKMMPVWKPGILCKQKVNVLFQIPIKFTLPIMQNVKRKH